MDDKRTAIRIEYPMKARPLFQSAGKWYRCMEVSEGGLRVQISPGMKFEPEQEIRGILTLQGERRLELAGRVIRITRAWIAVELATAIPAAVIMEEQRRLIRDFPLWRP